MEKQFKGVIFDLDGTIIDSMSMWRNLDRDFMKSQGLEYSPELSKQLEGMTLEEAAEFINDELKLGKSGEQILNEWKYYLKDQFSNHIPLKANVDKLICKLEKNGVKMCVATMTDRYLAECVLKRHSLFDKFEFIRTVYDAGKNKQHPDIYLQCADMMGYKPDECLVMEDTCHAIKTAKNAGFTVYAIDEATAHGKDEIKEYCDKYIMDFSELL